MALTNAQMQAVIAAGGSVTWPPGPGGTTITTIGALPSDPQIVAFFAGVAAGVAATRIEDATDSTRVLKVNADGSINAVSASSAPNATVTGTIAANAQAVVAPVGGYATWSVAIANSGGAWVGTIAFQGSVDGGATYPLNISAHVMGNTANSTAQSTTANGQWDGGAAPLTHVRAVATAWTSGTAAITFNLSQAPLFATMLSALPQGNNIIGGITNLAAAVLAADALALPTTAEVIAVNGLFNGSTVDLQRNNVRGTLLPSAARTAATPSAVQTNLNAKGAILALNISAASGTGGLKVTVQAVDPVSGNTGTIGYATAATAITSTTTAFYIVYPGVADATAQSSAFYSRLNAPLPPLWQATVTVGDASSYTYSLGYALIV